MPNLLNTSPEIQKEWDELLNQIPDVLDDDYSTEKVINGLRIAGWDGKNNIRAAGQLALLLHDSHDTKTLELLSTEDPGDKKKIVESIMSNLEDLRMDDFIKQRPEAMAYLFNAWNETHPDEAAKTFPGMDDQLTKGLRETFTADLPEADLTITLDEFAAGMIAAGFDGPDQAPLVTAIYKLGVKAGSVDLFQDIADRKYKSRGEILKYLREDCADPRVKPDIEKELSGELAMIEEAWTAEFGLSTLSRETFLSNAENNGWRLGRDKSFLSQLYDEALANENPTLAKRILEINERQLWNAEERNAYTTKLKDEITADNSLSGNLKKAMDRVEVNASQKKLDSERFDLSEKRNAAGFVERARAMGWRAEDEELLRAINDRIEKERFLCSDEDRKGMSEFRRKIMETPLDPDHYYTSRNALLREAEKFKRQLWTSISIPKAYRMISIPSVVKKSIPAELGEVHEERKAAWLKEMTAAGWTAPGDAELLGLIFDARLDGSRRVDMEYDNILKRMAKPGEKDRRERIYNALRNRLYDMDRSPAQEKIYWRIHDEYRIWQRLSPSRYELGGDEEPATVRRRIRDPHLAEAMAISQAANSLIRDEKNFIKFLTDSNISASVFYETFRARIYESAEKGIHSHSDKRQDVAFAEKLSGYTHDQYKVTSFPGSPEEINAQKERANAIIDGWVRDRIIFYTSVDSGARNEFDNEKNAFVSQAQQAGWNETYAHDREKMEDLFEARYDLNGNVIPAVDEAIRNFAPGDGDRIAARARYLDNVKRAITAIPQNERSAGAVRALKMLNNSAGYWEDNLKLREDFVRKAENCGFGLTKDELRSVFSSLNTSSGWDMVVSELGKGESKTYPQLPFSEGSRIANLQKNDLFVRMREVLKKEDKDVPEKEKTLSILEKHIADTAEAAVREREQELPRVIEEQRVAFEAQAAQFKDQALKLTEADLKNFSNLNAGYARGVREYNALNSALGNFSRLGDSMKAAAKDWNSEEARPFKEGLIKLDKAIGAWLNVIDDKKKVKPAIYDMIVKISPARADEWRVKMAQNEIINAARLMEREDQRAERERQQAQALAERQQQKEKLMTILRNIERTGNSYAGHTNTDTYNNMVNALKTLREHGRPEEEEQYTNLVQNVKERMKDYLDKKDGLESSWHKNGNVRRECAFLGLSIIDPGLGAEYIGRANDIRWRRNHISLETLRNKRGVGLLARSLQQAEAVHANVNGQVHDIAFENLVDQAGHHAAGQNNSQRAQIRAGAAERRNAAVHSANAGGQGAVQHDAVQHDAMKRN